MICLGILANEVAKSYYWNTVPSYSGCKGSPFGRYFIPAEQLNYYKTRSEMVTAAGLTGRKYLIL